MIRVLDVAYVNDYKLLILFNDGTRKMADLRPFLTGGILGELQDLNKFTQFSLNGCTIKWANGADLAPEFLYDIGQTL